MKENLKIGVIGLGSRGYSLLTAVMLPRPEVEVAAVCDLYEDRRDRAAAAVEGQRGNAPLKTGDYRDILNMEEIDAVVITASWAGHIRIAVEAMRAGKYVGCEVGGAYSVDECWRLVHAYEETKVPCMLLENCCYGRDELLVLNMVKQGLFGELVHCEGGYRHDLREEIAYGRENRHYRLANYQNRNCENYPTHEIGPIAKLLDINRGNRMLALNSVSSKSAGLHEYIMREKGPESDLSGCRFAQGDVVTTIIKCARGETITLTLDTTLPRHYSRGFLVQGTKALYMEDNKSLFLDGIHNKMDFTWKDQWNNIEGYRDQYDHPIWKKYLLEGIIGGHDGIDWLVFGAFFDAARRGGDTPIDVYDMAAWMSISALSEASCAMGGAPVAIPDFTSGGWVGREPLPGPRV